MLAAKQAIDLRPERILELSQRLSAVAGAKIGEIASVNRMAKMLSVNALIVASKAGEAGRGFSICGGGVQEDLERDR